MGTQIIRLTTTGRKSGRLHRVLLNMFAIEGKSIVIGSNAGADTHSHWFLNLEANPAVSVELSGEQYEAVARIAHGEEREQLWAEVITADSSYSEYPARTERLIPVVVLEPDLGQTA